MRAIILSVCVFTAACSGPADSPTSPTSPTFAPAHTQAPRGTAQTQAQSGTQLPLQGSYTNESNAVFTPPATLTVTGTATGNATHLGRFTATFVDVVGTTTAMSTGTLNLSAANGDQLFTTTSGGEDEFIPPNVSRVTLVATIIGGTGRFAAATGTFTLHQIGVIDFATATSSGSGSFEGHISLNK